MWSSDAAAPARHQLELAAPVCEVQTALPLRVDEHCDAPPPPSPVDLTPLLESLERVREDQREQVEAVLHEIENECRALVCEAVERLVGRALAAGECDLAGPLNDMVEKARRTVASATLVVRVHPEDLEALRTALEESGNESFQWREDAGLQRGDLALEGGGLTWLRSIAADLAQVRVVLGGDAS